MSADPAPPPDLEVESTVDGLVCEVVPYGAPPMVLAPSLATAWWEHGMSGLLLTIIGRARDAVRKLRGTYLAGYTLRLRLDGRRLEATWRQSGAITDVQRWPVAQIGRVDPAPGRRAVVMQLAGADPVELPLAGETSEVVRWIASTIQRAGKEGRERDGLHTEVPGALNDILSSHGG